MKDFRTLNLWQKAYRPTLEIYRATQGFPKEELYGLTSQIRRSAASVPANIAEGCGRSSDGDFGRFLSVAMGSASELEFHLLLARDLKLLTEPELERLAMQATEVKRMLSALIAKLKADR